MHREDLSGIRFIKSPAFARQATALAAWEAVDNLKQRLITQPDLGDVIKGTGGLRKVRLPLPGRGARGGGRVIYLRIVDPATVLLLAVYAKNAQEDLDTEDLKALQRLGALMITQLGLPKV